MRTYAARMGYLPSGKIALFERMRADVEAMPDLDPADLVSCHSVCRALAARHPGALLVDGFFHAVGNEHSWLDLGDGHVADMYPIASSGPFLVDASHWMVPWNRIYIPRPDLLDRERLGRAHHDAVAERLIAGLDQNRARTGAGR